MNPLLRQFRDFFVSLKLTVVLLSLSILLIFFATLDQVHLGVWAVQEKYFRTFFVLTKIPGTQFPIPVFPGGYFIGGLLLINLIAAHVYRFKLTWKKSGIFLTHLGLILLLVGELLTGLFSRESQMRLDEGQTKNYSESSLKNELAIIDTTDANFDEVVAIPEARLASAEPLQHPKLPFTVRTVGYLPNAVVMMRSQAPNLPASPATQGLGPQLAVQPLPVTYKPDETNSPAAVMELAGPEGSMGTWLVSALLTGVQSFDYRGRTWQIALRAKRTYYPFTVSLLKFTHDKYPGTEIPKDFASQVRVSSPETKESRDVRIFMNNPLRYAGMTFYQAGFDNSDRTTILQVVRNPGWLLPYVSCIMMAAGLIVQFGIHLVGFARKRASI